jgi:ADP-ribose pyrophosphatase
MLAEWKVIREHLIKKNRVIEVKDLDCVASDDGREATFISFECRDWCNVLGLTRDHEIVLIRQFRIGSRDVQLEIPGGVVDPGESAQVAAIRELEEETGYALADEGKVIDLGYSLPNPAFQRNKCHSFLAYPVEKVSEPRLEGGEMIEVELTPFDRVPEIIEGEELRHALLLNAFFYLLMKGKGTKELARDMKSAIDSL